MAVQLLRFRSAVPTCVINLALLLAIITTGLANLASTADLVIVVTDRVNPETGLCAGNRKAEDKGEHQEFQRLLKGMTSLLNDVIKANLNGSSSLLLLEMGCEDGVDVILKKIIDLLASNHVTGVVTITQGQVADRLVGVLQYQNIPVVEMVFADDVIRESSNPNHFLIPHYVYWQMKHVILTTTVFNWTALTVSYQGQASRKLYATKEIFTNLAFNNGICVLPKYLRSEVPAVIFQLDNTVSSTLARTDAGTVLLVGHYPDSISKQFNTRLGQSVLHLHDQDADGRHLIKAISAACNLSFANSSGSVSQHSYESICMNSSSLNMATFDVKHYLDSFFVSVSFLLSTFDVSMSPLSCNGSNISLECLLSGSREIMLDETSNLLFSSRNVFKVSYWNNENISQTCDFQHIKYDTLSVPECAPTAVLNKSCSNLCDQCAKCFPSTFSETKIATSGESDVTIIAFFPIHLSTEGGFCSKPNLEGYLASLAFLETVKSYSSTLNMSGIQGVVFDSCGSLGEVTSVLHSLDTCRFYFKEEVDGTNVSRSFAESSIIGYVNGLNNFALPRGSKGGFSLSLQDFGYSTGIDFRQRYINNILQVLSKIGWTVINVLVSDQEPFLTLSELLTTSPLSNKFCFVNTIVIHTDAILRDDELSGIIRSMNQTSAFLFFTTVEDSNLVLQNIREHAQHTTTNASFAFTQWNLASDIDKMLPYIDVILKFTPVMTNVSQTSVHSLSRKLPSLQTIWAQEFSNVSMATYLNSSNLAIVVEATEQLLDSVEANYNARTNIKELNLGLTAFRVSALYADRNYETEIAYIDSISSVHAHFNGPSFNVCNGWCPACHACPSTNTAQATNIYLDGDVLITGVFPLHQAGVTAFSCASPQRDVHKLLQVQSFMFAIETFTMRYPGILPGVRIGGLVLDSCSDSSTALKVIGDFETCTLNFRGSGTQTFHNETSSAPYSKAANPSTNLAYIVDINGDSVQSHATLKTAKLQNSIVMNNVHSLSQEPASFQFIPGIVQILAKFGWSKIIIISGKTSQFRRDTNALISEAYTYNICVVATFNIEPTTRQPVSSDLKLYLGMPVVILSSKDDSEMLFHSLKSIKDLYFWIIPVYHKSWSQVLSKQDYFPLGSIFIDRKSKENDQYNIFLQNLTTDPDFVRSLPSWFQDLWKLRFSCNFPKEIVHDFDSIQSCPTTAPASDLNITSPDVYDAILHVDAVLHSLHAKIMDECLNGYGICDQVAENMRHRSWSLGPDITFNYQGEQLQYTFDGQLLTELSIFNYQKDGVEQIGSYFKPTLTLNVTQIRFYTSDGSELNTIPRAACASACNCLVASAVNGTDFVETQPYVYVTTGEFIDDLWAIIALAIASFGTLLSLIFALYVIYKVTKKALGKRFVSLGLTLLFSVALLYMTILPFLFTPSEAVCGLRYFLTGLSYTLCFAVVLVKLMSLQSYKLIGLGGEVSKINQFLTTFFIVGVQIAIGVQWWLTNEPAMYSISDSSSIQKYTCNFNRREFVAYHGYVILLLLICCTYATSVRNEKKNMGEAKLLLACSCTCVIIWAIWLPCLVLLDRRWSDVIICAGILSCATAVLLIIFVPKIRMVSRLKYDLSQKTNVRNGHSLDTDFLYERPYSLPGTLTSTFSSAKMNYPKTASSFDADVNY